MRGAMPPLTQYVFMAWYLLKHKGNFTLNIYILHIYVNFIWNISFEAANL
jgi:hypothetical protein